MEPNTDLDHIVNAGLAFISALTERYGVNEGHGIYEAIMANVDAEAKGAIMFAMLTGRTVRKATVVTCPSDQRVMAIKAIRQATGFGLKEAKDTLDVCTGHNNLQPRTIEIEVNDFDQRRQLLSTLKSLGCNAY